LVGKTNENPGQTHRNNLRKEISTLHGAMVPFWRARCKAEMM
jgi:hypothetical protein